MNIQELNELDFSNIGDWPAVVKLGADSGSLWPGRYRLVFPRYGRPVHLQLQRVEMPRRTCVWTSETKQAKAANLEAYRAQLAEMQSRSVRCCASCRTRPRSPTCWSTFRRPDWRRARKFELFQPQAEVPKDFYAELPIKIRVSAPTMSSVNSSAGWPRSRGS